MAFDDQFVRDRIGASAEAVASLARSSSAIVEIGRAVRSALADGGTVLTCGNGGSAAEALHLAEELIGKYKRERRAFASVCLNADPTALTCIANDFGYERVFSRQVEGLGRRGDVLVVFSTSGNSANIQAALKAAREKGIETIGLLGKGNASLPDALRRIARVEFREKRLLRRIALADLAIEPIGNDD